MRRAPRLWLGLLCFAGVAMGQDPSALDRSVLHRLHSDDAGERAAAEAVVRAAAKWGIEHGDASLFVPTGEPEPRQRFGAGGHLMHGSPARRPRIDNVFAVVPALRDERVEVRAAAVVELRDQLGAWQRPGAMAAMGPQPVWWLAKHWQQVEVPAWLLPRIVAEAKAGRADAASQGKFSALDEATAKRLAAELIQAAVALGADETLRDPGGPFSVTQHRLQARGPRDELAASCLGLAFALHPIAESLALALATQSTDDTLRRRVITAFADRCEQLRRLRSAGRSFSTAIAPLAIALLDAADDIDQVTAATILALVDELSTGERDLVAAQVLELLPRISADVVDGTWMKWCSPGGPVGVGAKFQLLAAAAAQNGATQLIDPLLQQFEALRGKPALVVRSMFGNALGLLAPYADEAQRRRMYEAASSDRPEGASWAPGIGQALAFALFEFVPEDLVVSYGIVAGGGLPRDLQLELEARRGPLPRHLVTLLASLDAREVRWERLLPRAPELLLMAIDAGDEPRMRLLGARCPTEVVGELSPALLRRDPVLVTEAVLQYGRCDRPLELLAHCRDVPKAHLTLAALIAGASPEPEELRWLRLLCAVDHAESAAAAAIRAHGHGDEGRELWRETVARLGAGEPKAAGQALHAMLSVGEALADWREVAARAPYDWTLVKAAGIRFGGAAIDLEPHNLCAVLRHARVTVDVATLRALVPAHNDLQNLLALIPGAKLAVLEYLAGLPSWTSQLQHQVLQLCDDPDPAVRRAAYVALKSRDPELWPCAWLVREAEFDQDPAVREVAK